MPFLPAFPLWCRIPAVLFLLAMAGPGLAQPWQVRRHDDGSFFYYAIRSGGSGSGLELSCGERSARGVSPMVTGNTEPDTTRPGLLRIHFDRNDIPDPGADWEMKVEVIIAAAGQGYRLPPVDWNELFGEWSVDVAAGDTLFSAIAAAPHVDVHARGRSYRVSTVGFAQIYSALVRDCEAGFGAIGKPWPMAANPAPPAPAGGTRLAADAYLRRGCNGPYHAQPGAFLPGEIDGDGAEDIAVDTRDIACLSGGLNPFCGASMCSGLVFLSSAPHLWHQPIGLMSLGVRLQPLSNGNMGVAVGGSLSACHHATGQSNCEFLQYWNGVDLVPLN